MTVPLEDTGTEGPVTLAADVPARLMLSYLLPKTPQGDLGQGRANFYVTKLPAPFSRADITGRWFTLTIHTDDIWVPDYLAVFGLNTSFGQTDMLIPFVHAPQISLEHMSTDPSEGWESTELPNALVAPGPIVHPTVFGGTFGGMIETAPRRVTNNAPSPAAPCKRRDFHRDEHHSQQHLKNVYEIKFSSWDAPLSDPPRPDSTRSCRHRRRRPGH